MSGPPCLLNPIVLLAVIEKNELSVQRGTVTRDLRHISVQLNSGK